MTELNRNPHAPINFCHIAPTPHLALTETNGSHLLLAHLVEQDEAYANYYANLNDGKVKIMDNSAFEMFKQGRPMYPSDKLIEMGKKCKADIIVMSDYPKEHWTKTKEMAEKQIPILKEAGFGTFYVPQSELGDMEGLLKSFEWAVGNPDIDLIGVSILAAPIAFGLNESHNGVRTDSYKLQRFLCRWKLFEALNRMGLLYTEQSYKRFHCLGMTDGPNEIELLCISGFRPYIYSWDSSAAVWAGLNHISFDRSPSGLMDGKFEKEVDFNFNGPYTTEVATNINYINSLL